MNTSVVVFCPDSYERPRRRAPSSACSTSTCDLAAERRPYHDDSMWNFQERRRRNNSNGLITVVVVGLVALFGGIYLATGKFPTARHRNALSQ